MLTKAPPSASSTPRTGKSARPTERSTRFLNAEITDWRTAAADGGAFGPAAKALKTIDSGGGCGADPLFPSSNYFLIRKFIPF
jgi:hypothetical protein